MTFERSEDWKLIRAIATHPRVWDAISDDYTPHKEGWEPIKHSAVWYVLVKDGDELLGMFTFVPENAICWKVHTCMLPCAYGPTAQRAAKGIIQWIWEHTKCVRIITDVPAYNQLALRYAERADLERYGVNPRSYMKRGVLQDQILLGISKPETLCQ